MLITRLLHEYTVALSKNGHFPRLACCLKPSENLPSSWHCPTPSNCRAPLPGRRVLKGDLAMICCSVKNTKSTENFSAFLFWLLTLGSNQGPTDSKKLGFQNTYINQRLIHVKIDRLVNRVIKKFVALCNKLVFCRIFTRVGLKNQV